MAAAGTKGKERYRCSFPFVPAGRGVTSLITFDRFNVTVMASQMPMRPVFNDAEENKITSEEGRANKAMPYKRAWQRNSNSSTPAKYKKRSWNHNTSAKEGISCAI